MAGTIARNVYRVPIIGGFDPLQKRALQVAGAVGLAALLAALITPVQQVEITQVDDVPDRLAKLILEEPKAPPVPKVKLPEAPKVALAEPTPVPPKKAVPKPAETVRDAGKRRAPKPTIPQDRGTAGREKARAEVTEQLASVTSSLDAVLGDLSTSLASNSTGEAKVRQTRRRKTRGGRTAADLGGVSSALPDLGAPAAGSSSLQGARIAIESDQSLVSESWVGDTSGSESGSASHSDLRPDASLLAVVRKYAPGIQFCYDNELEKHPGLGGKFVVSITVTAAGHVSGAQVVKNTVGSPELTACALAQIETWRFPAIPEGVVTFQAPFVFTPPE